MDKKLQERMTNRIMLTIAISFVACIAMYYLYGAIGNSVFSPIGAFVTIAVLFVACAVLMMVLGMKEGKKLNLGIADAYKTNLKARLYFNFEIFFIVSAVLSLVIYFVGKALRGAGYTATMASGYSHVMVAIAIAVLVYNVALIVATFVWQSKQIKKAKASKISKKASAKAALKAKRSGK